MNFDPYTPLQFSVVNEQAQQLAASIRKNLDALIAILLSYESHEVALDEIARTLDLLDNLEENDHYFKLRIGEITTFLPRNQPLYALACFVLVPSLQSSQVHFRVPQSLKSLLPAVLSLLDIPELFPNVAISNKERLDFLKERSAIATNEAGETRPITEVVIFTGTPKHAEQLRLAFDKNTVFIANGAGHNPIVVTEQAHISNAVAASLTLSLYNQGQDCAAPSTILVHKTIYNSFLNELHTELSKIKIGKYEDRDCRIGPISNPHDLPDIQRILTENHPWLDEQTPGIIRTAESIMEPTIITKPLTEGGNYHEPFAPILFVQKYTDDADLKNYFETDEYATHAMYITVYGESAYITDLVKRDDYDLHNEDTFLHNTHLHAPGVERGTQPYGGYGVGASSVSHLGTTTPQPTLPQRDIFQLIARPIIDSGDIKDFAKKQAAFTEITERKVEKIMRLQKAHTDHNVNTENHTKHMYCDTASLESSARFTKITPEEVYGLLDNPNVEYIASLNPRDIENIRALNAVRMKGSTISADDFKKALYDIPKLDSLSKAQNSKHQKIFFKHLYWLLFHQDTGPRLAPFLYEVKDEHVDKLLDI